MNDYTRSVTSLRMEIRQMCESFSVNVRQSAGRNRWCIEIECDNHGVFCWVYNNSYEDGLRHAYRVLVRQHRQDGKISRMFS